MSDRRPSTIAADAFEPERDAACRATLIAGWPDLSWFDIGMTVLPSDAQTNATFDALQAYRTNSRITRGRTG